MILTVGKQSTSSIVQIINIVIGKKKSLRKKKNKHSVSESQKATITHVGYFLYLISMKVATKANS